MSLALVIPNVTLLACMRRCSHQSRHLSSSSSSSSLLLSSSDTCSPTLEPQLSGVERLSRRGILEAAKYQKWRDFENGWRYPIHDDHGKMIKSLNECSRWKAFSSSAKPKYLWLPQRSGLAQYYCPAGMEIADAVRQCGGELYVANGEPSVLTFLTAGVTNVLCWFGEGNIPPSFPHDCRRWGVKCVKNYPDLDETGTASSEKLTVMLSKLGIGCSVFTLPTYLGDGGDVNDLWKHTKFDSRKFLLELKNCSAVATSPEKLKALQEKFERREVHFSQPCSSAERTRMVEEVEHLLGLASAPTNDKGWALQSFPCAFKAHRNDHASPKAYWHHESGRCHCFKCSKSWDVEELHPRLFSASKSPPKANSPSACVISPSAWANAPSSRVNPPSAEASSTSNKANPPKTNPPSASFNSHSAKANPHSVSVNLPSPKASPSSDKANLSNPPSASVNSHSAKANPPSACVNLPSPKASPSSDKANLSKTNPPSASVNSHSAKANPPSACVNLPSAKACPPSAKTNPPSSKVNPPSSKASPSSVKTNPTQARANSPSDKANQAPSARASLSSDKANSTSSKTAPPSNKAGPAPPNASTPPARASSSSEKSTSPSSTTNPPFSKAIAPSCSVSARASSPSDKATSSKANPSRAKKTTE